MENRSIIIKNPLRSSRILPYTTTPEFKYSKGLVELRNKLRSRFYTRRVFRNRVIKYLSIGIVGLTIIALGLYLTLILWSKGWLPSNAGSWIGLNIAMLVIGVGLWLDLWLDNYFPTNTFYININKRKGKQ